jgi:sulfopyruvate decarboxylase subunit alpha
MSFLTLEGDDNVRARAVLHSKRIYLYRTGKVELTRQAMKKSAVDKVIAELKAAGVSVVCYLPDSLLKELYPALNRDPDIRTIRVPNEGNGAGICGGVWQSGKRAALVMKNSGLRASIEPLARMAWGRESPS